MQLLAKFAMQARKAGIKIDLTKITKDEEYAKEIFAQMDTVANEDLLVTSINVRHELGLLEAINVGITEVKDADTPDVAPLEKYTFGARG